MKPLFSQSFTAGQVAAGMLVSRQRLTDLCGRFGFETTKASDGWRRFSFADIVLLQLVEQHTETMSLKAAAALANALRPFVHELVLRCEAAGPDAYINLHATRPTAVLQFDRTAPASAPRWIVRTYSTLGDLVKALQDNEERLQKDGDALDLLGKTNTVNLAPAFTAAALLLSRPGVLGASA